MILTTMREEEKTKTKKNININILVSHVDPDMREGGSMLV